MNTNAMKNKVQLIGHLGAAPQILNLESGRKGARFSLATNEAYTNQQGQKVEQTTWHNIVVWGAQAEIAERMLDKGSQVMIEGRLSNRTYTDKNGTEHRITEVVAQGLLLLDKKQPVAA